MGAFVVYDPYWDPVDSFADEDEARRSCLPGARWPGCHVLLVPDVEPGRHADLPYVRPPWHDD